MTENGGTFESDKRVMWDFVSDWTDDQKIEFGGMLQLAGAAAKFATAKPGREGDMRRELGYQLSETWLNVKPERGKPSLVVSGAIGDLKLATSGGVRKAIAAATRQCLQQGVPGARPVPSAPANPKAAPAWWTPAKR